MGGVCDGYLACLWVWLWPVGVSGGRVFVIHTEHRYIVDHVSVFNFFY